MKNKIVIYTKSYCPYCNRIKDFLKKEKISFNEIEVSDKIDLHQEIISKTGHHTVPAVFIDDHFIGGSEDFYVWHNQNY